MNIFPKPSSAYAEFAEAADVPAYNHTLYAVSHMLKGGWPGEVIAMVIDRTGEEDTLIPALRLLEDLYRLSCD
jgi:hypothetical protein